MSARFDRRESATAREQAKPADSDEESSKSSDDSDESESDEEEVARVFERTPKMADVHEQHQYRFLTTPSSPGDPATDIKLTDVYRLQFHYAYVT